MFRKPSQMQTGIVKRLGLSFTTTLQTPINRPCSAIATKLRANFVPTAQEVHIVCQSTGFVDNWGEHVVAGMMDGCPPPPPPL